jgi:hypothetical protein
VSRSAARLLLKVRRRACVSQLARISSKLIDANQLGGEFLSMP